MSDSSSTCNFDNYIADLHENLDRVRDITDVDEQSSTIIADLAQAYSEHPSPMQTAMCLSALFSGQKNILTYLRRASSKAELKKTKVEILQFLKFFVENAGMKISPHAVELKTVLLTIFNCDHASDVRASIFPVLSHLMELSAGSSDMQNDVEKMATTFLDQIGLQSSKATATIKGLCLAFLGLLCKFFPEHMRKYADPLLLGQYLKYLHEQLVKDAVKFEMLIAAGAIEGLINYLVNFIPSSTSVHPLPPLPGVRNRNKEEEKRVNEERIRCGSDLKRIYIYGTRAIQTQDQTNLNRYALVKAGLELFAQHSTLFTEYLYEDYPEILRCIRAWNAHDNYDVKKIAQRAYDTFLLGVANALKETNIKTPEERHRAVQVFQYFIKEFRDKIDTPELEIRDLAMGIRGYGIFAKACKLYGTEEDVKFMFVGLVQRCEQIAMPTVTLSQAMDIFDERFYGLPNLIDALSAIIFEMTKIGEEFLGPLERLTVMTIDYYPRYQPKPQATTCSSVIKMILALQSKPNSYKPFLSRIVTQALIRCCSHPLKSTVEQQLENYEPDVPDEKAKSLLSIGKTITYENYLPLWKSILSVTTSKEFDTSAYPIFDRQNMLVSLYDEIIESILHIIDRLDLSVEKDNVENDNNDETTTTDPVFGMRPAKPKDFQIFYNLVDFCQDLLPDQTPELFQKWIFRFLYDIIAASTKYPLVSGIYRFATFVMNICLKLDYFKSNHSVSTTRAGIEMMEIDISETEQVTAVCALVRRFAHEVLARQKQYRDDLLVSCLQFIVSLPSECIDYDFADYVPAIQLALSIGLTYLPLAEQTINSLERWSQSTALNLSNFYNQILPYLDDFLRLSYDQGDDVNVRAVVSTLQEKTRLNSKTKRVLPTRMLKKTKQIKHLFEDSDIRRVQFRILKYLGSLGNRINHHLIDDTSNYLTKEAVAWDNENHITFNVPFDDLKPTIHLDIFLPRIVDLALHSSDRQAKVTACELLQSIMLYMIGKSANNRSNAAASYEKLYEHLFPAVLELSCDSDTFTKTLFTTFMLQMIHWFTKNHNYENPETMSMLDTFMDGMISGRNASIRDFSGICLKEFLRWTVKHAGGYDKSPYLKNATSILKRILSFSLHPNSFKRLGSTLAWNSIYTLYRESETLVDVYTLQLLYVFVESLAIAQGDDPSLGTQQQAIGALSHIERIIKEKSPLFVKETPKRHRPPSWTEASLDVTVRWLLRQCGRIETESRRKCIELVCTFIPLLPGIRSIREYFELKVKTDGNIYFIDRFEGTMGKEKKTRFKANLASAAYLTDMSEQFSLAIVYQWLDTVIASLDCYTWVFSQGFLNPLLFQDNNKQSRLIASLSYFISKISMSILHDIVTYFPTSNQSYVFTPSDVRQFDTAKCTVIVRLLNFITALWSKYPQDTKRAIDSSFYSQDLTKLILTCVFNPTQLGFDINNEEINKKLPERILTLLKSMTTHLPDQLIQPFHSIAQQMTKPDGMYNLTNELNMNPVRWSLIFTIARGFRLLHDVRLLAKPKQPEEYAKELWTTLLTKTITHEEDCDKANIVLTIDNQRGLQALFEYIIYLGIKPNEVLPYFFQSNRLHTDSGMATVGTYLLTLFKHQITSWLGTTPHFIINNVGEIKTVDQCRPVVSFLTVVLDLCSREKDIRQQYGRQFVDGIYTCWPLFSPLYRSTNLDDKLLIVTLLTKTFIIDSRLLILHEQFDHISQMYLSLLIDKQLNLTFKTRLLDLLPFFASLDTDDDMSEEKRKKWSDDLCRTLHTFTADCFPLKSTEFSKGTQEYHDYQGAIRKILSALELSSSFILFELLIWMLCCEPHHIFEDEILSSISRYVVKLNDQIKQLNLLDYIYSILFGKNSLFRLEHRLNALEKFILKILTSVKKSTLIEFYNKYISLLVLDQLDIKLDLTSASITSILINKVCTYRFIDYMYTILNKEDVFGPNSSIAKTFYESVKKQEEARKLLNVEMPITMIKLGPTADGKELTKYVIARARAQFIDGKAMKSMGMILTNVTTVDKEIKMNLIRSLAASSFNCLVSVLICTQTEAKLYKAFIFDANALKDECIWENLIDPDHKYTFPLELERYYKKDKRTLLNILSKKILTTSNADNQQRLSTTPRYLPSQYLFGSSLTDELAVFDFTSVAVSQQHNDLNRSQSNSLPENSMEISLHKKDDDRPALIEGTDDDLGTDLIELEMDELNQHPCMVPMVCLLKHMETNGITSSNTNTQSDMPPWMICLHKKFSDLTVGFNVKLFLMRLITHTHSIFKPYARYWLSSTIQMCNQIFEKSSEGLNTFLIDTIVILLSWSSTAIPSELDAASVQRLLEYLFLNCSHKNSQVMRSNLDLIKKLVESWKERIYTPTLILHKLISDPDIKSKQNAVGLSLIGILLANQILPYTPLNDLTEDKFNETLLKNMKNSFRNIYAAAAEVVGMLLDVKKLKNDSNQRLLEQLSFILKWHSGQGLQDTYVTCIYSLQKHYPEIVDKTVMNKLMFGLKKLYGDFKMECLEAMIANITEMDSAYLELKAAGILDILIHKDFSIRSVALRLLHKLLSKLTHDQLFEIAQNLSVDGPNECQSWTLEICKWMYDYITQYITSETKTTSTPHISETFYHHVRELLLQFLSSKNEYIRVNCRNFWCDPKRLSISTHHRLIALVDQLYSIKTENEYLNYSTNFLLERTTHNPDYNHFIFENPLDICAFQEFPLACNWRQRHHTYMTPLFTLQSQATMDPSNTNLMNIDLVHFMQTLTNNNIDQQQNPTTTAMLLQTQEMSNRQQFMPTQMVDNNNTSYNWLKQANTFDTTNTFALPTLSTQTKNTSLIVNVNKTTTSANTQSNKEDDDIFRLQRRFLKDTGKLHGYFARKQNEKKQKDKQFLTEIKLKQENQVEKYRSYRIGELPDIQIRNSDVIIPLQALAQYDNHIARLLYASLFTSILTSLEDKLPNDEYIELIETVQQRFDVMLSQSEIFYPSFIAALLDIVLSKPKQIKISAQYISAATISSHLESIGILTIEHFIRLNQTNDQNELIHGSSKKKFKSDPHLDKELYKQIEHWLELAKCYRSLANYDDVRGIFCQIPGLKPLTLQAIGEESHSDFLSALNTYVTALEQYPIIEETTNDPVLELEHEFWTQSMLNCCNQLNNWSIMSKHIFIAQTTFDTLWSNAYQLNYLMPYALRAKLKLLISGSEQEQLAQEDLCQFFNNLSATSNTSSTTTANSETTFVKRSYIEKQYPFELATFFLYQKDFDRSKYYIQYAKEQFLLRWSQLSRLSEHGRKTTLQLLQPYHELDQFLVFLEHNLPLLKTLENRYQTNNKHDTITRDLFLQRIHNDLLAQWQLPDVIRSSIQTWDDIVTNRALFLDIIDELIGGPRMTFTSRLKAIEFDPILVDYKVQSSLDMAYCALRQRNFKLALTKLNDTRNRLDLCENPLIKSIYWNEIYCDVHLKRHQVQSTLSSFLSTLVAKELKKMEVKINSLQIMNEQTANLNSTYIQLNSQFCRTVIDLLLAHPAAYLEYERDEQISQAKHRQLEVYLYGFDDQTNTIHKPELLINELFNKGVNILKTNIEKQETDLHNLEINIRTAKEHVLSRDYNELASLCDDYLRRYENNDDEDHLMRHLFAGDNSNKIAELVIQSVLSSMKYGSNEGVKRFSRILQIVELYPNTMQSIANRLQEIPCWMFFDCLYQITAHLDKPIALKLYPLIEQIVKLYPQAIVYPFKLSYETLQYSIVDSTLKRNLEVIRQKLDRQTPLVNEFIQALNQLNPQQQFESWLKDLYQFLTPDLQARDLNKLKNHLKKFKEILFSDVINIDETNEDHPVTTMTSQDSVFNDGTDSRLQKSRLTSIRYQFKNTVEKDLDTLFGKHGELFSSVLLTDVKLVLVNLGAKLKSLAQDKSNINDYSTWFSLTFRQQHRVSGISSIREIEIPGQYTSKKKPLLDHHIKIVGFDEKILVLHSLRLPKRLTIRGHDENDYRFLVKGGEDIRQDQRIQALFTIMNDLYDNDPNCNQSNSAQITLRTYNVIPMSSKLGMIEWLDNTRPLKELIEECYTNAENDIISQGQHPRKLYQDYVTNAFQKAKPTAKSTSNTIMYAELFVSLTKSQVQDEFNKIQSLIPSDLLRRAYYKMANSHEGFYTLRREFITSYAVLCTSHYILGIGDRHQSNFLIDTSSGQVIGIDFGSAFNAATIHLPVPELIPIRLTRQLIQLMSPIGTAGLFRAIMIHTMNALREHSDLLLSTMNVFIKEPLMEWVEHALKTSKQVSQSESTPIRSDDTYAKDRIRSARLKLNGINPAVITGADLKLNNFLRPSSLKEALRHMEKVVGGDQTQNKRAQILMQYGSNRYHKLTVDEQIDCVIDQATDVDILGRSWAGLETFM